jgi:hypothetical protein
MSEDCFRFAGLDIPPGLIVTKRVILSVVSRLYDPMGFCVPFVIAGKILMQDTWVLGLQWDEEVPPGLKDRFLQWVTGLSVIKDLSIPRCFVSLRWSCVTGSRVEFHVFGDASERAYDTVVYLRVVTTSAVHVSFVTARARVAPVQKVSVPRLELLAALISARFSQHVIRALHLPHAIICLYSDSQVTLSWIWSSPSKWKPFVANRVAEIQQLTSPAQWKYCPGSENPADAASRGTDAQYLSALRWLNGPAWLLQRELPSFDLPSTEGETSEAIAIVAHTNERLIDFECFSQFGRLLRTVAWVL